MPEQAGLHVLPTLKSWIATVNMWLIDVEGEYVKFKVQDMDNEVHPDAIFGHEAQVYVRKADRIADAITHRPIGDNLPIRFNFTAGTFIAVPPGKISGVGDRNSINLTEETPGWNNSINLSKETPGWNVK